MDLHLLKEAIEANHPEKADKLNKAIIESYRQNSKKAGEVLERLAGIEKRGRYKNRIG